MSDQRQEWAEHVENRAHDARLCKLRFLRIAVVRGRRSERQVAVGSDHCHGMLMGNALVAAEHSLLTAIP